MYKPTPEQVAKWREKAFLLWFNDEATRASGDAGNGYESGYVAAMTEQLTELVELRSTVSQCIKAIKEDRIEWEDFPPTALAAFSKLINSR